MYFVNLEISLPTQCYFCNKKFGGIETFAILEGHAFCPNCGYEIMGSEVEVQHDLMTGEDYDEFYYGRRRNSTTR